MNALRLRRDPVTLAASRAPWVSARYLFISLFTGAFVFAVALTAALTGAVLCVTLAGIPVLAAAAEVVRWCAGIERARLRPLCGETGYSYRESAGQGVLARLRTRWHDPAIWRDVAYVIGMYIPLAALGLTVLTVWLTLLAGITLPAWYWAPWQSIHGVRYHGYQLGYFPNGPHGHGAWGLYVDSLPKALLTAAACLVLFLVFNYVLVATARAHIAVARGLLGTTEDPLLQAKEVLRRPGPLAELIPNER